MDSSFQINKIHGFCPWNETEIKWEILKGKGPGLIPGDFVIEAVWNNKPWLITSRISSLPFYLNLKTKKYSPNPIEILENGDLEEVNKNSISELLLWEHYLDNNTFSGNIKKLPNNSLIKLSDQLEIKSFNPFINLDFNQNEMSFFKAKEAFEEIMEGIYQKDPNPVICMSAGFDSRLILSYYLSRGSQPKLITAGTEQSTDVKISAQIARKYNLEHEVIQILPQDYQTYGKAIAELTLASKPAHHWHTYIYPQKSRFKNPDQLLLVGSNGEFARTFFFDKGIFAHAFDQFSHNLLNTYFLKKMSPERKRIPFSFKDFSPEFNLEDPLGKIQTQFYREGLSNLDILDLLYGFCRVRNFIGNGLAMYRESFSPVSPFLDYRWLEAVAPLHRGLKLNNRLHRFMIGSFVPELTNYPTDESNEPMSSDQCLYWFKKKTSISYDSFGPFIDNPDLLKDFLNNENLETIIKKEHRKEIVDQKHILSLSVFLPFHFLLYP